MTEGFGLAKDWVSYPWRIDQVTKRLGRSTMIHSPPFPGAGRRWQLSLLARNLKGIELDALPLYITVIDPNSLVVRRFSIFVVFRAVLTVIKGGSLA